MIKFVKYTINCDYYLLPICQLNRNLRIRMTRVTI